MFLWCVQEVAELKEEDIISHTVTVTKIPTVAATQPHKATAGAGVCGDLFRILSEFHHNDSFTTMMERVTPVIMYSQLLMTCVKCWL